MNTRHINTFTGWLMFLPWKQGLLLPWVGSINPCVTHSAAGLAGTNQISGRARPILVESTPSGPTCGRFDYYPDTTKPRRFVGSGIDLETGQRCRQAVRFYHYTSQGQYTPHVANDGGALRPRAGSLLDTG